MIRSMARVLLAAAAWASVLVLAGCGSSADRPQASATATVTATTTVTASPNAGGPSPGGSASGSQVLELGDQGGDYAERYFATPSGNIGCYLLRHEGIHEVECTLKKQAFDEPPRPSDCNLDWAPQFTLGGTATYGACRGDVSGTPDDTVLSYGGRAVNGPISCRSETSGLSCRNSRTGHGFTLSRAKYRLS